MTNLFANISDKNIEITKEIGTCLLTGIITDTGGFRNTSVTTDSFEFDILVQHTDRADIADEYIKELRTNDRF